LEHLAFVVLFCRYCFVEWLSCQESGKLRREDVLALFGAKPERES